MTDQFQNSPPRCIRCGKPMAAISPGDIPDPVLLAGLKTYGGKMLVRDWWTCEPCQHYIHFLVLSARKQDQDGAR